MLGCRLWLWVLDTLARRLARHWRVLLFMAAQVPAVALAQQGPSAPSAPALPSASVPSLPSAAAPSLPGAPGSAGPAGSGAARAGSAAAPASSAPTHTDDTEVILFDTDKSKGSNDGVPPTLPRELRSNVKPGLVQVQDKKSGPLTIEEIVDSPIISASNRIEKSRSAPAWVIVLTGKDLHDRGYADLSQMLDDLPGMDVVRPYGDVYVKSYWRGYRSSGADPYLLMIDGVVMNSLFYKDTQILAAIPLSNIDHVEIVYGPASAVYGPNAAMGVINVITLDGHEKLATNEFGASLKSRITYGGPQHNFNSFDNTTKIVDASVFYTTKDFRLHVTTRMENSVLDTSIGNDFEYTKSPYYNDPRVWGQSVLSAYPNVAGQFRSPDQKRAVDARLYIGDGTEIAAQFYTLSTGLGTRYAADQQQTSNPWTTNELSIYGQHSANLSASVVSHTMVQYRSSGVTSPSASLSRAQGLTDVGPTLTDVLAPNSSTVATQSFNIMAGRGVFMDDDTINVDVGARYAHNELSRAYQLTSVQFPLTAADPLAGATTLTSPANNTQSFQQQGSDEVGAYVLGKYGFPSDNALHLGMRVDHATLTDSTDVTFRGGYVGTFNQLTLKLLYGQAVYAPSTYDLASAAVRGVNLKEERSQTVEADAEYILASVLAIHGDLYYVDYTDPIFDGENLAKRDIAGADVGLRLLVRPIQIWAYYSRYLFAKETLNRTDVPAGEPVPPGEQPIGDLAYDKVWAGATYDKGPLTATLLGRFMGPRDPVLTNPLGRVAAYFVVDANAVVSHLFVDGLWCGFRVTNLLNWRYSHPGMSTAGSGNTPGVFNGGTYVGSQDLFNSRLPQPGRGFYFTLGLDI